MIKKMILVSACVLAMSVTNAHAELKGYWDLNTGSGLMVYDQSPYANDGTIVMSSGFAWVSGKYGQALQFSSATSQGGVEIPDSAAFNLSTEFTIMAWVNPDSWTDGGMIFVKEDPDTNEYSFRLYQEAVTGGRFGFTAFNASGSPFAQITSSAGFTPGQWVHLAVTFSGGKIKFYQDGSLVASKTTPGSMQINAASLRIGDTEKNGDPFNGKIDEVRIYSHAMTEGEILIAMNVEGAGGGASPTANAGTDLTKAPNTPVQLNGSGSNDSDGNIEYYLWTRKPEGALLCFDTVATCGTTTLGRAAEVIELRVVDNDGNTAADTMTIFYQPPVAAVCGNGTVEPGETCDSNSQSCVASGGYAGTQSCNTQCNGFNACASTQYCGDGTVNGNETCDSTVQACTTTEGYSGSRQCNNTCSGYGACVASQSCGDSVVNGGEVCDGNSISCTTAQGYAGLQQCNGSCSGYGSCVATESCGDGTVNGNEVCDGNAQACTTGGGESGLQSCKTDCTGFETACNVNLSTDYTQDPSCVGAWNLDDTSEPIQDLCGNNTGDIQGGYVALGINAKYGKGVEFLGSGIGNNAKIDFGSDSSLDNLGPRTVVAWIKPDSWGNGDQGVILSKNSNDGWAFRLYKGGRLRFTQAFAGGVVVWDAANGTIQLGEYQHVAVTYAGNTTGDVPRLYFNGVEQPVYRTSPAPFGSFDNDSNYSLQLGIENTAYEFDGVIDEVGVFNRQLSQDEIQEIMNNGLQGDGVSTPDNRPKLMPLGASITSGYGDPNSFGYRDHLQDELGINTYNFVGPYSDPAFDSTYQVSHSGIPGNRTDEVEARLPGELNTFVSSAASGSSILIHVGTNDVLGGIPLQTAIDNMQDIVDIIDAHNPAINIYIALLMPVNSSSDASIVVFNAALKSMLDNYRQTKSNVHYVDMHNAFVSDTFNMCGGLVSNCMYDTIHPNDTGYNMMAKQWASCMANPGIPTAMGISVFKE